MSAEITLTFPDRTEKRYPRGVTPLPVNQNLDPAARARTVGLKVDGRPCDLRAPLTRDTRVEPLSFDSPDGREVFRHSSSHLMAQAVKRLFPGAKLAIGPAIEDGFYYDFEFDRALTPDDLEKIEATMRELARAAPPPERPGRPQAAAARPL